MFPYISIFHVFIPFSFALLALLQYVSLRIKRLPVMLFYGYFAFSVLVVFLYYIYLTYAQYMTWLEDPIASRLLPPYAGPGYILNYFVIRFLIYHLVAFAVAVAVWFFGARANKRAQGVYFEVEELPIAACVIFLLGSPLYSYAWLSYFAVLVVSYFIIHSVVFFKWKRRQESAVGVFPRVPLYFFWAGCGLLVILIEYLLK